MFKNCRKEDLRIVALELELIQYTTEDRKRTEEDRKRMQIEEDHKKEAENRLREKELELELARLNVRVNSDNEKTERVQMLLGAEVFYELMLPGQFKMEDSNVIFQNTVFGFIVSGSTSSDAKGKEHCGFIQAADNLELSIKKF
ncbi:hypothetical protein TNCV_4970891 [Trichonephila clavipes]|nr:hypothetical protein TNCV_4970891 [Trichonephila clavipes]